MAKLTPKQILALPMPDTNDADASTVGEYLSALLIALIEEGEGFSGKRPIGNSDWQFQLAQPLVEAGLVEGEYEWYDGEDGESTLTDVDWEQFNEVLKDAIEEALKI